VWAPLAGRCQTGDFCNVEPYELVCARSEWMFAGGGDTATCSPVRPLNGADCYRGLEVAAPPCGYFCPDGTWTVAACGGPYPNMSISSEPPCSGEELPLGGAAGASGAPAASGGERGGS
jgi:hypothetical protein